MKKATLGVIGGLGPIATAHFMTLVIEMTDAKTDQEHLDMIIFNSPEIPDRTAYILDSSKDNPLPYIIEIGNKLSELGASHIAIPCITAHYFHNTLASSIPTDIIHIVKETVSHLKENGIRRVGIMATDGTLSSGLFKSELESREMEAIVPSAENQKNVMSLIYDCVKAGVPADMDKFRTVQNELVNKGAECIILGCTELSLIKRDCDIGAGFIDAMEVLAQRAVIECGGKLKDEYKILITK